MGNKYPQGLVANMRYAVRGVSDAWRGLYFRIGIACGVAALMLSYWLQVSKKDAAFVIILIGIVLAAEIFNTAIEKLCDIVHPEHDARIACIKDLSAGAVLVVGIATGIAGTLIFLPYIL